MSETTATQCVNHFCGLNCSKIRWIGLEPTKRNFLTSSTTNRKNELILWEIIDDQKLPQFEEIQRSLMVNCINDVAIFDGKCLALALDNGDVSVFNISDKKEFENSTNFENLHGSSSSMAVLHMQNDLLVSGGSDGSIYAMSIENTSNPIEIVHEGSAVTSMTGSGTNIFVTSHLSGEILLWDIRLSEIERKTSKPVSCWNITKNHLSVTSTSKHPADTYLVGFGTEEGHIGFIDTRNNSSLVKKLQLPFHAGPVWQVNFHHLYPNNFYCASESGTLLWLDVKENSKSGDDETKQQNLWLDSSLNTCKAVILFEANLPLNSFDISHHGLLAAGENRMLTLFEENFFG